MNHNNYKLNIKLYLKTKLVIKMLNNQSIKMTL